MTSPVQIGCEIVAALMKADRTHEDLVEVAGCSYDTARRWTGELHRSGLVFKREQRVGYGRQPTVWAWQKSPFDQVDQN